MLSIASIFLSILVAGASPARRATCSPNIMGTNISITNGPLEAGFSSNGPTLVSQPLSAAIPEFAVATSNIRGGFTLQQVKVTNESLALTNTGTLPEMLSVQSPSSSPQSWAFQCSSCVHAGGLIGQGCLVVSQLDGRCLNISLSTTTPVGSPVTLGNCQAIGSSYVGKMSVVSVVLAFILEARDDPTLGPGQCNCYSTTCSIKYRKICWFPTPVKARSLAVPTRGVIVQRRRCPEQSAFLPLEGIGHRQNPNVDRRGGEYAEPPSGPRSPPNSATVQNTRLPLLALISDVQRALFGPTNTPERSLPMPREEQLEYLCTRGANDDHRWRCVPLNGERIVQREQGVGRGERLDLPRQAVGEEEILPAAKPSGDGVRRKRTLSDVGNYLLKAAHALVLYPDLRRHSVVFAPTHDIGLDVTEHVGQTPGRKTEEKSLLYYYDQRLSVTITGSQMFTPPISLPRVTRTRTGRKYLRHFRRSQGSAEAQKIMVYNDCDVPLDVGSGYFVSNGSSVANNFAVGDDGGIARLGNAEASDAEDEEKPVDAAAPAPGHGRRNRVPTRRYEDAV
ncbi:hypothetical protein C8R45DRAFT_938388 [Mycena sanguinolenta]|nr:hypothetical protein C8R45DRAFT_938388 [Mycena sanguinolenta]